MGQLAWAAVAQSAFSDLQGEPGAQGLPGIQVRLLWALGSWQEKGPL